MLLSAVINANRKLLGLIHTTEYQTSNYLYKNNYNYVYESWRNTENKTLIYDLHGHLYYPQICY